MSVGTQSVPVSSPGITPWILRIRALFQNEALYLLIVMTIFLVHHIHLARTRALWFDEFFTLFISRLSSFSEMLKAMPADGQPPLQYLLTHLSLMLPGQLELVIRLPELFAYCVAALLTYRIVRVHGNSHQALFALTLVLGAQVSDQAFTARPYSLLLVFTTLTFACWQVACLEIHRRIFPLCGVAVGTAAAVTSHHFGLIHIGLFLFVGEATRAFQRRRIDLAMTAAIVIGFLPLLFTIPLAHQSRALLGEPVLHSAVFWARPRLGYLKEYFKLVPLLPIFFVAVFAFIPWPRRSDQSLADEKQQSVPRYEWAAASSLFLLFPIQLILAAVGTGYFQVRYAISSCVGFALIFAWGLPHLRPLRSTARSVFSASIFCYLLVVIAQMFAAQEGHATLQTDAGREAVSPLLNTLPEGQPIVVANAYDFAPYWWYSAEPVRKRLIYLSDLPLAVQQTDFLPELSLVLDKDHIPLPSADYKSFTRTHSNFLLLRSGNEQLTWTYARLVDEGWHVEPISQSGQDTLYQVSKVP